MLTRPLCSLLALLALASCAEAAEPEVFDVSAYGAIGDGLADDQPAISEAVAALTTNSGGVLRFPAGVYRCARQAAYQDGIFIDGISNVTITFEPGAKLLMDNLHPKTGMGDRGHGVRFRGPGRNIRLENVVVEWKAKAKKRTLGDAFRFEGYPSKEKCLGDITMVGCRAADSPQVGAVFMGCEDVTVRDFTILNTWADGLHFNACRRVRVDGVEGIDTGDDVLAFVTYYEDDGKSREKLRGPYGFAELGEWSNVDCQARNILARGGHANGLRVSGSNGVQVTNLDVKSKTCGVMIDCGIKDGKRYKWSYMASRNVVLDRVAASDCFTGIFIWSFTDVLNADTEPFWRFGVSIDHASINRSKHNSVCLKKCAGVEFKQLGMSGAPLRFEGAQGSRFGAACLEDSRVIFLPDAEQPEIGPLQFDKLTVVRGPIAVTGKSRAQIRELHLKEPPAKPLGLAEQASLQIEQACVPPNSEARAALAPLVGTFIKTIHNEK